MDSEGKFWLGLSAIVLFFVCLFTAMCLFYNHKLRVDMAIQGYQHTMVVGNNYPVWQKVKGE